MYFQRCLYDRSCFAYEYKEHRRENCVIIKQNCTDTEGQMFQTDGNSVIYKKGLYFLVEMIWFNI